MDLAKPGLSAEAVGKQARRTAARHTEADRKRSAVTIAWDFAWSVPALTSNNQSTQKSNFNVVEMRDSVLQNEFQ